MYTFSGSSRTPVGATTGYSTSDPLTGSITVNPRDTLLVTLILNSGAVARAGGAPTFGGHTMLQADTSRGGLTSPEIRAEMWYITASGISLPSISGSEISVPNTNGDRMCFDMVTARAGDGKTSVLQVSTGSANATTSTNPYCRITTTAGSTMIFEIVADGANSWAPTARTGTFTNINDNDIGTYGGGMMYSITNTVGVITGSWTFGTAEDWGVVMAAFGEIDAYIYVQDCVHALTSDSVVLTYNPPQFTLTVEIAEQAQTSENTILTYHEPNFTLTTQDAEKLQAADNVTLTQNYLLTVQDAEQAQTAENVVLSAYYVLTFVDDAVQLQTAENIILTARGPPLVVQDVEQAQTADNVTLIQNYSLTVQDAEQTQTADNVTLAQNYVLTVQDAQHLQTADDVILTQNYVLTVQDAEQAQTADNVTIAGYVGIIANIDHEIGNLTQYNSTSGSNITVTTTGGLAGTGYGIQVALEGVANYAIKIISNPANTLRVRFYFDPNSFTNTSEWSGVDPLYVELSDTPWELVYISCYKHDGIYCITPHYRNDAGTGNVLGDFTITDESHYIELKTTRASTNISSNGTFEVWIDGVSKGSVSNIDNYDNFPLIYQLITGAFSVASDTRGTVYFDELVANDTGEEIGPNIYVPTQNATQPQTSDNIVLTQHHVLTVQDAEQAQTSDNINLLQGGAIGAQDAQQAQTSDNVALTQHQILVVQDAIQLQSADNVILTAHYSLTVQDTIQTQNAKFGWWLIGKINPVNAKGIYQAKAVASYADSKINLGNPGTNDLYGGNPPSWNNVDGLVFTEGSNQYLKTGIVPSVGWSMIVKFTNGTSTFSMLVGAKDTSLLKWFDIFNRSDADTVQYSNGSYLQIAPALTSGVLAFAGQQGYRNGIADGDTISLGNGVPNLELYVGMRNESGTPNWSCNINIQAIAIYDTVLTSTQVRLLTNAMVAVGGELILVAHYSITVQDAQQAQTSENVVLTQHYSLTVNDAIQLQTSENVVLTQNYAITIQDATQLQTAENVALTQHHILTVNYAVQIQTSDNISIGGGGLPVFFMHYRRLRS